ncbi:hypothetical protein [Dyella flagellata]|uniref:Uncharacterized protein n=1 Tax=Dyella flagellata TaxID=1867833 RepID=A0ABQ5XAY3_9GAMM|nr:hypothetical protein [Dyella flagellata]GLQ88336.1 hypothetical protein GCM10007898_19050 [Dyella flagellata]
MLRFDEFLNHGGRHLFEITMDEMPELQGIQGLRQGIKLACRVATAPARKGSTWCRIVEQLAARDGSCVYKQVAANTYRVVCTIPQRSEIIESPRAASP